MSHTEGPWAWMRIGEKINGYVVGVACDRNGKQLSGYIDDQLDMVDGVIYKSDVGDREGATVNYADAELISAAPNLLAACKKQHRLIEDMCRFLRIMALEDYALLNEALIEGPAAIAMAEGKTR